MRRKQASTKTTATSVIVTANASGWVERTRAALHWRKRCALARPVGSSWLCNRREAGLQPARWDVGGHQVTRRRLEEALDWLCHPSLRRGVTGTHTNAFPINLVFQLATHRVDYSRFTIKYKNPRFLPHARETELKFKIIQMIGTVSQIGRNRHVRD